MTTVRPLVPLADKLVAAHRVGRATPVLVTPRYLSLAPPFFTALSLEIARHGVGEIRFDWYRVGGRLADLPSLWWARRRAVRINRCLHAELAASPTTARIELTAAISRPGTSRRVLLVGLSDAHQPLPAYAAPVHFAASREECFALQSRATSPARDAGGLPTQAPGVVLDG